MKGERKNGITAVALMVAWLFVVYKKYVRYEYSQAFFNPLP